jgi:hypothetical protein
MIRAIHGDAGTRGETPMRRKRFFLAGTLSLCLALGVGLTGCGDDGGTLVDVDVARLCAQSLQAMNSQGCIDTAYADVDDLKDCLVACGPTDRECLEQNCLISSGTGFSECTGDVEFLFGVQCGVCYFNCGLDFAGEEVSDSGCLFDPNQPPTGTDCLDELYACVDRC